MNARERFPLDECTIEQHFVMCDLIDALTVERDAQQATIDRLTRECKAWMNGVADAVEPLGYDRGAACGPADLLPGLDTLTKLRLAVVDQCIDDYMKTPNQGRGVDLATTEGDDGHRHVADAGMDVSTDAVDGPVRQEHGGGASEPKPALEGERVSDPPAADPRAGVASPVPEAPPADLASVNAQLAVAHLSEYHAVSAQRDWLLECLEDEARPSRNMTGPEVHQMDLAVNILAAYRRQFPAASSSTDGER